MSHPVHPSEKMDRLYRYQRHVYDLTRRFLLVGRDLLLERLDVRPGNHVLEAGCGTARNLIILARRVEGAHFYGLDASAAMLETARSNVGRRGLGSRIRLARGLAEELDSRTAFGLDHGFDHVFFSYSLSMILEWRKAVERALEQARRSLLILDFWDLDGFPVLVRGLHRWWTGRFGVTVRPELLDYLMGLEASGMGRLTVEMIAGRYALLACVDRRQSVRA